MSAASRLSYSMAKTRFVPPVFAAIDRRGVPWFSIIFGGVFGCLLFLPFGSWAGLVAAITAASSFMYSFAPVAAVSLRKSDPDRLRPYRAPILNIIAPFSFVVSGFIIYWSGTANVIKLDMAVVFFLILYLIARRIDPNQEPLDFRAGSFAIPWIIGLTIFSIFGGSYVGGISNAATGGYDDVFRDQDRRPPAVLVGPRCHRHLRPDRLLLRREQPPGPGAGPRARQEAAADAHQEDLDLGVGHAA